jgi:D-sedoheptulose 7-phosphate isomerase
MTALEQQQGRRTGEGEAEAIVRTRLSEAIAAEQRTLEATVWSSGPCREADHQLSVGGPHGLLRQRGSSTDAQHLAAELLGRFYIDRPGLSVVCLNGNTAAITAIANDYSYDDVFVRQLAGLAKAADVAVGHSTNGKLIERGPGHGRRRVRSASLR